MKFAVRSRSAPALPGVHGTARVHRRTAGALGRLREGDVAVLDHLDMDRATAQALVDAGVVAVVNAGPMISGRYPNLGPELLVGAGVTVVDDAGPEVFERLRDGVTVRIDGGEVHAGDTLVASARELTPVLVRAEMDRARAGLVAQLESFTHNSTEFLRREEDLLLHGRGVPRTATEMAGRAVVVTVRSHGWESELRGIRPFVREQRPVLIGVDRGADALVSAGHRPDVVVVTGGADDLPPAAVLRKARDVVVLVERGAPRAVTEPFERLGIRPLRFETTATTEDAALLLASASEASLVVGVGMHATLDEFLDRRRPGLASTFLTRLKLGPDLVDAAALPRLYDGAVRPRHLAAALAAGVLALTAAVSVTPVGQQWVDELSPTLTSNTSDLLDNVRGILP
ncbi:thiamin pyrophosphokinase [Nocardioides flavus (ex Wang et al. 2016)]|uniref:Thiamin pyrophosphokinase n=1 Tax=Nocardioides flavus (ex Wang et al. 2016) TaxID=2058780 RepID=A0ABQ3HNL1_9ACTN|nr:putative cytokinetic ring protein SteA [Nocardioides flavus (ex Wang et al. 2016)]GHE19121.1 thiamin pyrophosphokinase [Nocardioides flavus (ex Wang et al. 2016)]